MEVPAGSGQYYRIMFGDVQHEGFDNEYVLLIGVQCNAGLLAFPPASSSNAVGVAANACGLIPDADEPIDTLPPGPGIPPVPPLAAQMFHDTFNGTAGWSLGAHLADTGEMWTVTTANLQIYSTGHGVLGTGTVGAEWGIASYTGPEDGEIILTFTTWTSSPNPPTMGILFRVSGLNTWLAVATFDVGDHVHSALYGLKNTSGSLASWGSPSGSFIMTNSTLYELHVQLVGDVFTAWIVQGGSILGSFTMTDSAFAGSTGVGLYCFSDSGHASPVALDMEKV